MSIRCLFAVVFSLCVLAAAALTAAPARAQARAAAPVALVTDVDGAAQLESDGQRQPLALLAALRAGSVLQLAEAARVTVAFTAAGRVFEARGPGRFRAGAGDLVRIAGSGAVAARTLAPALQQLQVRPEAASQLSVSMRSGAPALAALAPRGVQFATDARELRWQRAPTAGAAPARVRVADDDGRLVFEAAAAGERLTLPDSVVLRAGVSYVWEVEARGADGRSVVARAEFSVLDADGEARWRALIAASADDGADATGAVLVALALQQDGLEQASRRQWQHIAAARPAYRAALTLPGAP